jgi:hypothetical protein
MGQIWSNQSGSVKAYVLPPVPGGLLGQSAALAVAQGSQTPGAIASQTAWNYFSQLTAIIVLIAIILLLKWIFEAKQPSVKQKFQNVDGVDESDPRVSPY